jgi:hypothetical protein
MWLFEQIYILFHWLYSPHGPWPLIFQFMIILQTVVLLGQVISRSQGLHLNSGQHKHRINTYTYKTSMPYIEFEPTIPASYRSKRVYVLDHSATVADIRTDISCRLLNALPRNCYHETWRCFIVVNTQFAIYLWDPELSPGSEIG